MCLLIALQRSHPEAELIIAANRDEVLTRPSMSMALLDPGPPRVLGGRDLLAGGTWLAINEHGLFAGLTNLPSSQVQRDPAKRSRGELPLFLARHQTAEQAVDAFRRSINPGDYNRAWLLVGDRDRLFYVDMTGSDIEARSLRPGNYVLENCPLDTGSPKQRLVAGALGSLESLRGEDLVTGLYAILKSHEVPRDASLGAGTSSRRLRAACLHDDKFGTRSSLIALVPRAGRPPELWFTDGPPCRTPLTSAQLWQ